MAKTPKGLVVREKLNQYQGLKSLTGLLLDKKFSEDKYGFLVNKYGFDLTIIKRVYSYFYNSPKIISYINKYMNDLYTFNSYTLHDLLKSISIILKENGIFKSNDLYFFKSVSKDYEHRLAIKNLLKKYFHDIYRENFNDKEIDFYYKLYLNNIITDRDIVDIDKLMNNNIPTIKIKIREEDNIHAPYEELLNSGFVDITDQPSMNDTIEQEKTRSLNIKNFIDALKSEKEIHCAGCKLSGNKMVVLDTNMDDIGPVDVAFIALNPGLEEAKHDQPLTPSGKSGNYVRSQIARLDKNIKWVIYNTILCSTKDKTEIGTDKEVTEIKNRCHYFTRKITSAFPAKLYVLIGADAAKMCDLNDPITKISGKRFGKLLPVVHPSGMRTVTTHAIGNESWNFIINEINKEFHSPSNQQLDNISDVQPSEYVGDDDIEPERPVEKISDIHVDFPDTDELNDVETTTDNNSNNDELFLLDVKEFDDNTLMYIYTDKNGKKVYKSKPLKVDIYIKNDDFHNCEIITDKIDTKLTITKQQKFTLSKLLKDQVNQLKRL